MNLGEAEVMVSPLAEGQTVRAILIGGEIVSAIAQALRANFSTTDLATIYKNKNQQEFVTPCAFIHLIDKKHDNLMRGRAQKSVIIDVRVHPSTTETKVDVWADLLGERVMETINHIMVDQLTVKATSLESHVEEDVLHVLVSYSFAVRETTEDEATMQALNIEERMI